MKGDNANCVCVLAACKAANKGGECVFRISHSRFLFERFICIMSIPFCLSSYPVLFILLTLFENISVNDCPFFSPYVFLNFIFAFLFIFLHSYLLYIAAKMVQKIACKYQLGADKVVLVISVVLECRYARSHSTLLSPLE